MKKLGLIIPYRNRFDHLKVFLPQIKKFLENKIEYMICIIEQTNEKPFNRAKLLNIGFDVSKEECSWFCFHDIDMVPVAETCDYSEVNGAVRLSQYVSQFRNIPRPSQELGGVTLIDKESFEKVNGYSNEYWGWGCEDDDFYLRCIKENINISARAGVFSSLEHKPNGDTFGGQASPETIKNRKRLKEVKKDLSVFKKDGLNSLQYELKKTYSIDTKVFVYNVEI